tara:strand:- start:169 stop:681 length:513 start_codon:yes stop_codon:yes gene_type:complete
MIARISSIEIEEQTSPRGRFALRRRLVSEALRAQDPDDREAPFDIEFAQLPPGKRNYPHHSHATEWELYYALAGAAMLRVGTGADEETLQLEAGSVAMCPPGLAHQLINSGSEDFTYLVISNNAPFDTYYYPDSDKVFVNPVLGANKDQPGYFWTKFRSGASPSYFDGEE